MYRVEVTDEAKANIKQHMKAGSKKLVAKIVELMDELSTNPRQGRGKPEQLKGFEVETWSRRLDSKHRLIYEIREHELVVTAISAYGHYGDK
ncbi:MAG: Txe/YoeB family addiction module toxin [Rikenellaceae bacterium]